MSDRDDPTDDPQAAADTEKIGRDREGDEEQEPTLVSGPGGETTRPPSRGGAASRDVTDFGDYVRSDDTDPLEPQSIGPQPRRIGPYLIRERLGHGGMGAVYRAEQLEPIRRDVAIKLILAPLVGEHTRHRFEAERQALARMNHSFIARVFEAGDTAEGQPYFAMELVNGLPIDRYCDEHELSVEGRLELLIAVCQGIQHAHQKGILHRDIKPDNILMSEVEGVPVPKIIDFGVAKALDEGAANLTAFGLVIGTPAYVSPEALANSVEVDTRSDVYSLGVLLFELLTGSRPFGRRGDSALTIFSEISEKEAPAPSVHWRQLRPKVREKRATARATVSASHARRLRGDLDWITLKAMSRERDQRYASAAELAADLGRHLHHEPVTAARPGRLYRLGKFVRRRKGSVLAVVLLLVTLTTGIVARTAEARRANQAAEAAREAAIESQEVVEFLVELFKEADPSHSQGASTTVREMLDRGAIEIRGRLRDQPLPRARLLSTMGRVYEQLGLFTEARLLLNEALVLRRSVLPSNSPEVASSVQQIGHLNWLAGDYPEASKNLALALSLREESESPDRAAIASALDDLGSVYVMQAKFGLAEPVLRRALALREELFGFDSLPLAASLDDLAVLFVDQERPEEALPYALRSLEIRRSQLSRDHPAIAVSANTTAINYFLLGRWDEGIVLAEESLAIRRRVLPQGHPDIGQSLNNLAEAFMLSGRLEDAEEPMGEALAIWEKTLGPDHRRVGVAVQNLADLAYQRGDIDGAETGYLRAIGVYEESLGKEHPTLAHALESLGDVRMDQGAARAALELYTRVLEIRLAALPAGSSAIAEAREKVGRARAALTAG